jgi:hypothetical protein
MDIIDKIIFWSLKSVHIILVNVHPLNKRLGNYASSIVSHFFFFLILFIYFLHPIFIPSRIISPLFLKLISQILSRPKVITEMSNNA